MRQMPISSNCSLEFALLEKHWATREPDSAPLQIIITLWWEVKSVVHSTGRRTRTEARACLWFLFSVTLVFDSRWKIGIMVSCHSSAVVAVVQAILVRFIWFLVSLTTSFDLLTAYFYLSLRFLVQLFFMKIDNGARVVFFFHTLCLMSYPPCLAVISLFHLSSFLTWISHRARSSMFLYTFVGLVYCWKVPVVAIDVCFDWHACSHNDFYVALETTQILLSLKGWKRHRGFMSTLFQAWADLERFIIVE